MWEYTNTPSSDELYHYGVPGMRWGHRKKYQTASGGLNALGKARKQYEDAKAGRKKAYKEGRNTAGLGIGIKGIEKYNKAQEKYDKARMGELSAKAKYNAAKAKNREKANKAEFNTYRKAMQKTGLPGSAYDRNSFGNSTKIYNEIKAQKGKAYADRVVKKAENVLVKRFVATTAVTVGAAAAEIYLVSRG